MCNSSNFLFISKAAPPFSGVVGLALSGEGVWGGRETATKFSYPPSLLGRRKGGDSPWGKSLKAFWGGTFSSSEPSNPRFALRVLPTRLTSTTKTGKKVFGKFLASSIGLGDEEKEAKKDGEETL